MYFEFDNTFIKELSQLLAKDFSREDWLRAIGTMSTGVITGDKIGILPQGSFKDVVKAGCKPTYTPFGSPVKDSWLIKNFGIYKEMCYDDLEPEVTRGMKLYDLASDESARFIMTQFVERAVVESVIARAFFANSDTSKNTTTGLDEIDGLFVQAINLVAGGEADSDQIVPIATNSKAYAKTGTNAIDILESVIEAAPAEVKGSDKAVIIVTQALYDALRYNLTVNKGFYVSEQLEYLFNGMRKGTYNGYELIVMPALDSIILNLQSGDQFYQKPLLAFMSTKDNIRFGSSSDEEAGIADLDIFNDRSAKTTKINAVFSLGVAIADPKSFVMAY